MTKKTQNTSKKNTFKNNKKSKPASGAQRFSLKDKFSGGNYRQVTGLFFIILALYLLIASISYLLSWNVDYDKLENITLADILTGDFIMKNWTGRLGAALAHLVVYRGFGIASLAIPYLLIITGTSMLAGNKIMSYRKQLWRAIIVLVWLSVSCGFIFGNTPVDVLGGLFGYSVSRWLIGLIGGVGTALLLIFSLLSYLIFGLNINFEWLGKLFIRHKKPRTTTAQQETEDEKITSTDFAPDTENTKNENNFDSTTEEQPIVVDKFNKKPLPDSNETINPLNPFEEDPVEEIPIAPPLNNEGPIELVLEKKNKPQPQKKANGDVEFTVEQAADEKIVHTPIIHTPGHQTLDTPFDPTLDLANYTFPTLNLLKDFGNTSINVDKNELESNKHKIVETLRNYSIEIQKIKATIGPTVTLYEIIPAPGIRISKIKNLEDDIALSLAALGIRIIAPIPGKGTIGIEVPNQKPEIVPMRAMMGSEKFINTKYELPFAMGKTIANESFIADLTKMPHILMAGATGQGKSVGLNVIITSLLYKKHPSQLKFVLIDPKKVELSLFNKIERHFLAKLPDSEEAIITDTQKVVTTLNSLNIEMDARYDMLKDAQVRNIKEYNTKFIQRKLNPENGHHFLPYIVVVIDEFADLIMTAGKEIEFPIARLAQLARAIGIHLIIATQRPSVNIITGAIKANFPARIAFRVISKIDSRTILDTGGADQLIGRGDMLLSTGNELIRLQCAFVDTPEVDEITDFIGSQQGYPEAFVLPEVEEEGGDGKQDISAADRDDLFEDAARIIVQTQQGSTSMLQRKLKLGYNRAGRIIDQLEAAGIVGPFEGSKAREVKVANEMALEQFLKDLNL